MIDHVRDHHQDVALFTDGSKGDEGVGYAVVTPDGIKAKRLPNAASIYTAELSAIRRAIVCIGRSPGEQFTIFSDSLSALQSSCDAFTLHPIIKKIHRLLNALTKTVTFCWVPSHIGVNKNETADQAAKEASTAEVQPDIPLPYRDYYPYIHKCLKQRWTDSWRDTFNNKLRNIKDDTSVWNTSCRKIRHQEVVLVRIRIGHTRLTHSYLLNGSQPPICEDCFVTITVKHILTECPNYSEERTNHFGADGLNHQLELKDILKDDERSVNNLFNFLSATNLMHEI